VALSKVIDDLSVLAVEGCLVRKLPGLLSADVLTDLADEDVARLGAESEEATAERARLKEKLRVLESSLTELKRLKYPTAGHKADEEQGYSA
jgi:hypothetical protein